MRLAALALALSLAAAAGAAAARQETETPSSRPPPSPGNPHPQVAAPLPADLAPPTGADRRAALEAVRDQCVYDRARFCRGAGPNDTACLASKASQVSPDCQSALSTLKEAAQERGR